MVGGAVAGMPAPGPVAGSLGCSAVTCVAAGRTLLAPTTLDFPGGTVTGIVGHNGSGKTTLLRCLARQLQPTAGTVSLDGQPVGGWGARPFARRLGYLPQQTPASTGLTGRELVAMGRYPWHGPLGRVGPHGEAAIAEAMRLSDTEAFGERLVDTLSGGERQRVWIAMLIAQETAYALFDEPLAALDLAHQVEVMGLLQALSRSRHAGIVLVIHDINIAARYCDRIVALRDGQVIAQGTPADLMRAEVLGGIFGLPMRVLRDGATRRRWRCRHEGGSPARSSRRARRRGGPAAGAPSGRRRRRAPCRGPGLGASAPCRWNSACRPWGWPSRRSIAPGWVNRRCLPARWSSACAPRRASRGWRVWRPT